MLQKLRRHNFEMLLDKHRPSSLKDMAGNAQQIREIKEWLRAWTKNTKPRALLVQGPIGTGKSLAVRLAARELGYELMESHGLEERSKQNFEEIINASRQGSIFARKKIIMIEDIEMISGKSMLARLIKESLQPVVLVTENAYESGMQHLVPLCHQVRLSRVDRESMLKMIKHIAGIEGIKLDPQIMNSIVINSEGDMRSAIIDLETSGALRERGTNIFDIVKKIFRARIDDDEAGNTMLLPWIAENIQGEFKTLGEIASAYECLAVADLYSARAMNRGSWPLQLYLPDIFSIGMKNARKGRTPILASYHAPRINLPYKGLAEKIGQYNHVPIKNAHIYVAIYKQLANEGIFANMDEEDITMLQAMKA